MLRKEFLSVSQQPKYVCENISQSSEVSSIQSLPQGVAEPAAGIFPLSLWQHTVTLWVKTKSFNAANYLFISFVHLKLKKKWLDQTPFSFPS